MPANARQAPFLPYDRLLPRTSVTVTNGGWGGVLASLAAGVPLVVAGGTLDKPEIARRVAWSGTGVDLRTGTPRRTGCAPPSSASSRSRRSGTAPARSPGRSPRTAAPPAAAELVERLGATRRPVLRTSDPWATAARRT